MKNLKTYEHFINIFKKDYRKKLVNTISNLAEKILNCKIKIKIDNKLEKSIFIQQKNSRFSDLWCSIDYEKELGVNGSSDFCIWFYSQLEELLDNFILSEFIINVIEKYSNIIKTRVGGINIIAYNIQNKDIPKIIEQLTFENYEEFQITKKFNL